jgi:hypothetical protein
VTAIATSLGPAAVVPFEAHRLARPRVILANRSVLDHSEAELLERFAWAVPAPSDPPEAFTHRTKTLFAERYGGEGIGFHGGGVRVGSDGGFQIKGIGKNSLAGEGSLLDYTHGGMSLFEGLQEAIWSQVFDQALPFGAVRAPVVLATGSPCWWVIDRWGRELLRDRYGDDTHLPRGLLVREAAIRPAHFERAMLHRPPAELAATLPSDVERVRSAIGALPDVLPLPSPDARQLPPVERLRLGLVEMARRFAAQAAAARSKRLVHGNISPSNICLDGRWIDFGSVTALPGWGDLSGYGSFWDDGDLYGKMFTQLSFNIRKYSPLRGERLPGQDELREEFTRVHADWLQRRFLSLTGVPFELLEGEEGAFERTQLFRALVQIARSGHGDPFVGHPDDASEFGTYRLGSILLAAARWFETDQLESRVASVLGNAGLRETLLGAYVPVMRMALKAADERGVSRVAMRRLMVMNAAKVGKSIPLLYRAQIVESTERMVLAYRDFDELRTHASSWFQDIADQASVVYEDPDGLVTTLWRSGGDVVRYDASRDVFLVRDCHGAEHSWAAASRGHEASSTALAAALEYWGDEIREAIR